MDPTITKLLDKWKRMRSLLLDLLEVIPEEALDFTIGMNMGTIGKQYRHIGDVQICYNEGIRTGKISFSHYQRDYSLENSKESLIHFLRKIDLEMMHLIEDKPDATINWFGKEWTLEEHLQALIEHEILHQGELIVYIKTLGITFPHSWHIWGL